MAIPRNLANIAPHVNASSTELVVNDGGANLDFRVEGDTNANLLFVDASADRVGIGTNAPTRSLHIVGGSNSLVIERTDATSSALLMVAGNNAIEIFARASNLSSTARDLTFYAGGGDNVLSLNANRTIKAYSTVSVGDATPSTSGAGITFPATQSASTDANTLDDYEEGTFTPGIHNGISFPSPGGSALYEGRYTKIGNVVYVTVRLNFNASGTNMAVNDAIEMNGLPFSSSVVPPGQGSGSSIPSLGTANRAFFWSGFRSGVNFGVVLTDLQGTVNFGNSINLSFAYFV